VEEAEFGVFGVEDLQQADGAKDSSW